MFWTLSILLDFLPHDVSKLRLTLVWANEAHQITIDLFCRELQTKTSPVLEWSFSNKLSRTVNIQNSNPAKASSALKQRTECDTSGKSYIFACGVIILAPYYVGHFKNVHKGHKIFP